MSTVSIGKEFENQVAELYRLMGYQVKQNVGILGHQIDIILTYTQPGGIATKTAVECKYVEKGNLGKNDVMDNINALVDLKRNDEVQNIIIVTTNGFAKEVWDTAKANKIQLLTFRELQHQILKLDQYLNRLIIEYENDELSKYYVNLVTEFGGMGFEHIYNPIDIYIEDWICDSESNHLSILGEYGTGKTSFCRKLAHDLAKKYMENPLQNRIPILINLRDYSKVMSVRQLITDLLINEYGIRGIDYPLFEKMNADGLFLLIFDGFDEMSQKVIFDDACSNFIKIAELANPQKSKVILTCRTEFFRTHEKEKEILLDIDKRKSFDIIYLKEFNDDQIKEFLQKRVPLIEAEKGTNQGWEYYYEKIQNVFDLKDLAKRPVLLDLITKYLPQLVEKGEKINASTLYLTTIQEELKRKLIVGKTVIEREDRLKLMKLLAIWMYNQDKLSVHYENIHELLDLKKHFDLKARTDIEYHLNNFLTCSFLSRDTEGNYRFSHKSFVDLLVAWKFVEDLDKDFKDDFVQKQITYEVLQFMKDFEIKKDRLYQWIESTKEKSFFKTQYLGCNAVSILNELGENFAKRRFNFSRTVLDYANFNTQDLTELNFREASLKRVNLNYTILKNTNFTYADLEKASFEEMGGLNSVVYSPDGKYLASASEDGTIRLWDALTLNETTTFKLLNGAAWGMAFSLDGKFLASANTDKTIRIWDLTILKEQTPIKGHNRAVWGIAFSWDCKYLASASEDGTIKLWDAITLKEITTLKGHADSVWSVAFSPNSKFLASASEDQTIKLWDVLTLKEITTLKGHTGSIWSVVFSPDGKFLASASEDGTIKLWDALTLNEITTLKRHTGSVWSVAFSPNSKFLASASEDETIKLWDVLTLKEITTLKGHTSSIWSVVFSPDGKFLASASWDKSICCWSTESKGKDFGKCLHIVKQQINCKGMKIKGVKGLSEERMNFLKARGAVE